MQDLEALIRRYGMVELVRMLAEWNEQMACKAAFEMTKCRYERAGKTLRQCEKELKNDYGV